MSAQPKILDRIVRLTAINDLEMIEESLLTTVMDLLDVTGLEILKSDSSGKVFYQRVVNRHQSDVARDEIEVADDILKVLPTISDTQEVIQLTSEPGQLKSVWHVLSSRAHSVFLIVTVGKPLRKAHKFMIKGLLGIDRNFYSALSESQLDQLTGLPNRRTFDQAINKIYLAKPEGVEGRSPERRIDATSDSLGFWLGMADIDKFKRVNDTWGHLFGDEVLLLTAQLMQAHFRENDFLFRFGGEEFVIIVAASNKDQALIAFERFRAAVEAKRIPQVGNITISIGVTEMQSSIFSASLLDHADKALYFAKDNGRNQVHLYEDLVAGQLISDEDTVIGEIEMF